MEAHKTRREKKYTPKTSPKREPEPLNETLAMLWSAKKRKLKK